MSLISFIILTRNSERWIEEALHSVINQTYGELQIIIADDGSEDKTVEKISAIRDPRIELYKKGPSGISASFNFALEKVKGEYIARLDSDDYCMKERVSVQLEFMAKNPEYGITGSNFLVVDESGKIIDKIRNPEKDTDIKDQLPRRCCIWIGSALMRTDLVRKLNGFNEKYVSANDWDFFLRAAGAIRFYNLQKYLTAKRYHPASISFSDEAIRETEDILLLYNNSLIEKSGGSRKITAAYFNIGYHYYYNNKFETAEIYFNKAIRTGETDLRLFRYFIFSKYLKTAVKLFRKYKLYKIFNWLRYIDKTNRYFRNKF